MYAVTAWMVQPLTCILVGTKMEKLQTNTNNDKNQTQNKNNQQQEGNKKKQKKRKPTKEDHLKWQFQNAQYKLLKIEANRRNDTPMPKDEIDRVKCQAIIDNYLKSHKSHENNDASTSKTNNQNNANSLITDKVLALANDDQGCMKPVDKAHWPQIAAEIRENAKDLPKAIYFRPAGMHNGFFLIKYEDKFTLKSLCQIVLKSRFLIEGMRLTLIPASQLPKIVQNKPSVQQDQQEGTQLPVNYFAADQLSANMSDQFFSGSLRATYIRAKRLLQEMATLNRLTVGQKKKVQRAKKRVQKYEKVYGSSCEGTVRKQSERNHTVAQKQAVNKNNKINGKSFNAKSNVDLRMQEIPPKSSTSNCDDPCKQNRDTFQPDYIRAEVPSTSGNYRELEMERVPQLPNFNRNDNSRAKSQRKEFTSTARSSWESEMAPVNAYPSRIYGDSDEESYYKRRNEKFQPNYIRAEVPSTFGNYRELEMERVPQPANFNRNDNFRANSHRTEFISSARSSWESEMASVNAYPSRIYGDSNAESYYKRRNDQKLESFSKRNRGDSAMGGDWSDFPSN